VALARPFAALALGLVLPFLAGCPGREPGPAPARTTASLRLVRVGPDRAAVVACVTSITGYAPALAGRLVDRAPVTLPGLPEARAREGQRALSALGAEALVLPGP
jgi:hypothetical protein